MATTTYDTYRRLEPAPPYGDLNRGFRAEVGDPVWFLGRQWRMGEHAGEDASSPIGIETKTSHQLVEAYGGDPLLDPGVIPPEAIVESEPSDWWTPGRRVRIGAAAAASLPPLAMADPALLLHDMPAPWDRFNATGYDGYEVWLKRATLNLPAALFADVPLTTPTDLWDPAELAYTAAFQCGGSTMSLSRHTGGRIDWHSVDSNAPLQTPQQLVQSQRILSSRLSYPGAPHPRWWQIENHRVDIGGFPPDRSHFATMLLIDLIVSHSDDWFVFPMGADAGSAVTFHDVQVTDSFGETWALQPPANWSLFSVKGLDVTSLLVWSTVAAPLSGPVLEDVALGVDEDVNVLWAVEQRVHGRDMPTPSRTSKELEGKETVSSGRKTFAYEASSPMYPYWHPYQVGEVNGRRRYVQSRLADLNQNPPALLPEPRANVLQGSQGAIHTIEPPTVPTQGLKLERRMMLARGTDGRPVLWSQRRRLPLLGTPAMRLEFDRLVAQA